MAGQGHRSRSHVKGQGHQPPPLWAIPTLPTIVDFIANDEPTGFGSYYTKSLSNNINHIRANVRYYE
jgi:hypothetical protein